MNRSDHTERYLRVRQILEILPVSRSTFYAMIRDGRFPPPARRLSSRCTLWRERDVYAALENQELASLT